MDVPSNKEGVLQDVHWGCGAIGYFPSYTLGKYKPHFKRTARLSQLF